MPFDSRAACVRAHIANLRTFIDLNEGLLGADRANSFHTWISSLQSGLLDDRFSNCETFQQSVRLPLFENLTNNQMHAYGTISGLALAAAIVYINQLET